MTIHHRYAVVQGHRLFYREAGEPSTPALLLLHGYPASSFMYRDLIPQLCRPVPGDRPGPSGLTGFRTRPRPSEFNYTFDAEASLVSGLLTELGVHDYSMFVHSHGAEIGWRLALKSPDVGQRDRHAGRQRARGRLHTQRSGSPSGTTRRTPTPQTEAALRPVMSCQSIMWQYLHGVPDPEHRQPGHLEPRQPRSSPGPATTRSSSRCSATTRATSPCTTSCTSTSRPAGSR